jgi:hypothetical protein
MARRFKYRKRTPADAERHLRYITGINLPDSLRQARGGNLKPLHDYFRAHLPADQADLNIDLLKGLRFGRSWTAERDDEDAIIGLARIRLVFERLHGSLKDNGGTFKRVILWSAAQLAEAGELRGNPKEIKWKRIHNKVRRGKPIALAYHRRRDSCT